MTDNPYPTEQDSRRDTRITLAPPPHSLHLEAGATYLLIADFSEAGQFVDEDCHTALQLSEPYAVVSRNENLAAPHQQAWTLWTSPHQTYRLYGYGHSSEVTEHELTEHEISEHEISEPNIVYPDQGTPHSYGYGGRGGTMVLVRFTASVKNEGWTGKETQQVPTRWTLRRIA